MTLKGLRSWRRKTEGVSLKFKVSPYIVNRKTIDYGELRGKSLKKMCTRFFNLVILRVTF